MYITTVCVGSCLAGKGCGGPKLGWVSVCLSAGQLLVGAGWAGAFMASGVLVRHRTFCWGYVKFIIWVVVIGNFFVNKVSFYGVEVGSLTLVLRNLHCFMNVAKQV